MTVTLGGHSSNLPQWVHSPQYQTVNSVALGVLGNCLGVHLAEVVVTLVAVSRVAGRTAGLWRLDRLPGIASTTGDGSFCMRSATAAARGLEARIGVHACVECDGGGIRRC